MVKNEMDMCLRYGPNPKCGGCVSKLEFGSLNDPPTVFRWAYIPLCLTPIKKRLEFEAYLGPLNQTTQKKEQG